MLNCLAVFIGGGIGSVLRYLAGVCFKCRFFPFSTFLVNIIGCFILGIVFSLVFKNPDLNPSLKNALTVGFCGGLTTFSTFSLEGLEMLKQGQVNMFLLYAFSSLALGITSVYLGTVLGKNVF